MFKTIKIAVVSAAITSFLMNSLVYLTTQRQTIATVDIASITSQFIKEEALKKHSHDEKEIAIKAFSHRLENTLQDLALSKSLVLLPKEAVLKGSLDYTNILKDRTILETTP